MGPPQGSDPQVRDDLRALGRRFGRELDDATLASLARYVDLLHTWNARINLTGARTPAAIVQDQLPDSFALAQLVPQGVRLVDVGSGGGLPGLPFAVLRPDVRLTLTEPRGRRRAFLATAMRELTVAGDLLAERAEQLPSGGWDGATARAVMPPGAWLEAGRRLVVPGGTVYLFVGADAVGPPAAEGQSAQRLDYPAGSRQHTILAVSVSRV